MLYYKLNAYILVSTYPNYVPILLYKYPFMCVIDMRAISLRIKDIYFYEVGFIFIYNLVNEHLFNPIARINSQSPF